MHIYALTCQIAFQCFAHCLLRSNHQAFFSLSFYTPFLFSIFSFPFTYFLKIYFSILTSYLFSSTFTFFFLTFILPSFFLLNIIMYVSQIEIITNSTLNGIGARQIQQLLEKFYNNYCISLPQGYTSILNCEIKKEEK